MEKAVARAYRTILGEVDAIAYSAYLDRPAGDGREYRLGRGLTLTLHPRLHAPVLRLDGAAVALDGFVQLGILRRVWRRRRSLARALGVSPNAPLLRRIMHLTGAPEPGETVEPGFPRGCFRWELSQLLRRRTVCLLRGKLKDEEVFYPPIHGTRLERVRILLPLWSRGEYLAGAVEATADITFNNIDGTEKSGLAIIVRAGERRLQLRILGEQRGRLGGEFEAFAFLALNPHVLEDLIGAVKEKLRRTYESRRRHARQALAKLKPAELLAFWRKVENASDEKMRRLLRRRIPRTIRAKLLLLERLGDLLDNVELFYPWGTVRLDPDFEPLVSLGEFHFTVRGEIVFSGTTRRRRFRFNRVYVSGRRIMLVGENGETEVLLNLSTLSALDLVEYFDLLYNREVVEEVLGKLIVRLEAEGSREKADLVRRVYRILFPLSNPP